VGLPTLHSPDHSVFQAWDPDSNAGDYKMRAPHRRGESARRRRFTAMSSDPHTAKGDVKDRTLRLPSDGASAHVPEPRE